MLIAWSIFGIVFGVVVGRVVALWPAPPDRRQGSLPGWLLPALSAILFAWLAYAIDDPRQLIAGVAGVGVLLLLAALDLSVRTLPNVIVFPALLVAVAVGPAGSTLSSVVGALCGLAFFGGLYWLGRKLYGSPVLGMGDVKLAMLLGALLGATAVWYALVLGMVMAGLAAALLLLGNRVERTSAMPYGAFMAVAGLLVLVAAAGV